MPKHTFFEDTNYYLRKKARYTVKHLINNDSSSECSDIIQHLKKSTSFFTFGVISIIKEKIRLQANNSERYYRNYDRNTIRNDQNDLEKVKDVLSKIQKKYQGPNTEYTPEDFAITAVDDPYDIEFCNGFIKILNLINTCKEVKHEIAELFIFMTDKESDADICNMKVHYTAKHRLAENRDPSDYHLMEKLRHSGPKFICSLITEIGKKIKKQNQIIDAYFLNYQGIAHDISSKVIAVLDKIQKEYQGPDTEFTDEDFVILEGNEDYDRAFCKDFIKQLNIDYRYKAEKRIIEKILILMPEEECKNSLQMQPG